MSAGTSMGNARLVRETEKAVLVAIDDLLGEEVWIPKTCIHDDSEVFGAAGDEGELVVAEWFARKQGWDR